VVDGMKFRSHCGAPAPQAAASPSEPSPPPPRPAIEPTPAPAGAPPGALPPLDAAAAQGLIARVTGILLSPSTEWPKIAAEASTESASYLGYVAPLAAIGVIAGLIGYTLIGANMPFVGLVRTGMLIGLVGAIFKFLLTFLGVFVVAWLVDVLAPTFGGQ